MRIRNAVPAVADNGVQFPPRPQKGPVDYDALRKEVMDKFPKIRSELAK